MDGRISNLCQVASVKRYELTAGAACGLKVIECDNGKIRFLLNESKALDMMQLFHEGQNVSFVSKNGFTSREQPFANRFEGGMLYTCGLDSLGGREGYELHGSIHNTPSLVLRAECGEEGITVEAEIAATELFGKNLVLRRKVFSKIGSETVEISDTLINRGYRDEPYCLLYHINVGFPMLDEGAKIVAETESASPRTDWAAKNVSSRENMTAPKANEEEMCYFLKLKKPQISLVNEKLGKVFTLSYSGDTLPHFIQWKSMTSGDYALGLEPSTTQLDDGFCYTNIAPQKSVAFFVKISISHD